MNFLSREWKGPPTATSQELTLWAWRPDGTEEQGDWAAPPETEVAHPEAWPPAHLLQGCDEGPRWWRHFPASSAASAPAGQEHSRAGRRSARLLPTCSFDFLKLKSRRNRRENQAFHLTLPPQHRTELPPYARPWEYSTAPESWEQFLWKPQQSNWGDREKRIISVPQHECYNKGMCSN